MECLGHDHCVHGGGGHWDHLCCPTADGDSGNRTFERASRMELEGSTARQVAPSACSWRVKLSRTGGEVEHP